MIRFVLFGVIAMLIGLVVHLASLLALPSLATKGGYQRLVEFAPETSFRLLPAPLPSESLLPTPDPAFSVAVCRYDLAQGPVHVRVPLTGAFLSLSFYAPDGLSFYSLADRAAAEDAIELTLYSSLQLAEVRAREGPDTPEALRVEAPEPRGMIVIRALAPEPGFVPQIEKAIGSALCGPAGGGATPSAPAEPADGDTTM